jgi:metal-responsive CopG/Arc/MetJ family transcriptional regulator
MPVITKPKKIRRVTVRLSEEDLARIDGSLEDNMDRSKFIFRAIRKALERGDRPQRFGGE